MDPIDKFLEELEKYRSNQDDDFTDRLNYVYTSIIFGSFAFAIGAKQFFGEPISCFSPAEYAGTWDSYTLDFCYITNTYFVTMDERFPTAEERPEREIPYYQWMAFILGAQLFLTFLPKLFLGSFHLKTGLAIQTIATEKLDEERVKQKARSFVRALEYKHKNLLSKQRSTALGTLNSSLRKSTTTRSYLIFKLWNTLNAIVQLILINQYIAPSGSGIWGYDVLRGLSDTHAWKKTGHFPRVSYCDVSYRDISGKPITYTVQCTLMINLLNEKIFIFCWYWLFIISILNVINLAIWLYKTQSNASLDHFVKKKLVLKDKIFDCGEVRDFISTFLFVDGVTALRLVELNYGDVPATRLMITAWKCYKKKNARSEEISSVSKKTKLTPYPTGLNDLYIDN